MPKRNETVAGMSDEAVRARTGKGWSEWFRILDRAGARRMTHREIAKHLSEQHLDSGWWAQMVTVAYEQARGMREKHQKPSGYEISRTKTLPVSIAAAYRAWNDPLARSRWLGERGLEVRKATHNKSLRMTWTDGASRVNVNFTDKGRGKAQITVQHGKLPTKAEAERRKAYWGEALLRLERYLSD